MTTMIKDRPMRAGDPQIAHQIRMDAESLIPTLQERARQTEKLGRVPEESIHELSRIGVFKMTVPTEFGGYALTPTQQLPVFEAVARGCGSTGWVSWVTTTSGQWMTLLDREFQEEVFGVDWEGPLASGVVNANGPGTARKVDGGYMLKGRWPFCSGCHYSAFHHLGAICRTGDQEELLLLHVPHGDVTILDDWDVLGLRGTGSNSVLIEDELFVPQYRVLPFVAMVAPHASEARPQGLLYRSNALQYTAAMSAGVGLGVAKTAVETLKATSRKKGISTTDYKVQSAAPVTHLQLGELHSKLNAAALTARNSADDVEALAMAGKQPSPLDRARTRLDTAFVMRMAGEITNMVMRASGATSVVGGNPAQRLFRDAHTMTTHAQMNYETCSEDFGRIESGMPPFGTSIEANVVEKRFG